MELTVLGSGTAVPDPDRGSSGFLVREGDYRLLLDCGLGTLRKLSMIGVSLDSIDAVAVSHLHLDHVAELAPLLFALKNTIYRRTRPLRFFGGAGIRRHFDALENAYGKTIVPESFEVAVEEVQGTRVESGPLSLTAVPVMHSPSSVAFRIESAGGRSIGWSGDTAYCPGLVEVLRNVDLAVVECSFPEGMRHESHLNAPEAGRAAAAAGARKLLLCHFYPECAGHDLRAEAGRHFGGEVVEAKDLLRLEV